jgi:hypothetical protein
MKRGIIMKTHVHLSIGLLLGLGLLLSCTGEREKRAKEDYVERKVQERYEIRVQAIKDRCKEDNLAIAKERADSLLRKILISNLSELSRPGVPSKPKRPGFQPSPMEREVGPLMADQLLLWLYAYESFVAGDTISLRLYLDSVYLYTAQPMPWDSLVVDSLFFESLFQSILDHY